MILFADDIIILYTNSSCPDYGKHIHTVFELINKRFKGNFLSLNFEKKHYFHFITKNNPALNMKIGDVNKLIPTILHTKFLGVNVIVHCPGELIQNGLYLN
jgi:hypothetical protein